MKTSGSIWGKIVAVLRATVVGWVIALVLQVVWSALLVANLRLTPAVPWAAPTILVIVWCAWNFLGGKWDRARALRLGDSIFGLGRSAEACSDGRSWQARFRSRACADCGS